MAIRYVRCRNAETGGEAELPETALGHLPAWEPISAADTWPDQVDGPPEPALPTNAEPAAARPARKREAADAATTEGVTSG